MIRLARRLAVPVVLTNAARMARREQAATADVLDAARRLAPLDVRTIDRRNAEGYLKPGEAMAAAAEEAARLAGEPDGTALLRATRHLAERCRLDPVGDVGLGEIRLPEFETLGTTLVEAPGVLRARCEAGLAQRYATLTPEVTGRLDDELSVIGRLGFESYFLTVADVVGLIRELGIRCAARGSGAGSLVNYALGISGVDPIRHGLIMERFLSPLRVALPDIDLDVESARRTEVYDTILATFGGQRVACVAMIETYRVRHAVRDVGAALSLPPVEVDAMAKAFPHIRARDARAALRDLPELRAAGLGEERLDVLFSLVESLDGLPRHIALHPCGVILSDSSLGQRTPLEASFGGYPMSQFDKDDVEDLGLLKLDVLGIRMQSAMSHALTEIARTSPAGPPAAHRRPGPLRRPGRLRHDRPPRHARLLPDRVARPAGAGRQVRPRDLPRPHRRHLPLPSRPGEVGHDHPVPGGAAGLGAARIPAPQPHPGPRADPGRGGVPRADHPDHLGGHRLHPGPGRRGAPGARRQGGPGAGQGVVLAQGPRPRLRRAHRRTDLGDPRLVRLLRVLQGARRRVRAAHLPVGVAEALLPGALPRRHPHA